MTLNLRQILRRLRGKSKKMRQVSQLTQGCLKQALTIAKKVCFGRNQALGRTPKCSIHLQPKRTRNIPVQVIDSSVSTTVRKLPVKRLS